LKLFFVEISTHTPIFAKKLKKKYPKYPRRKIICVTLYIYQYANEPQGQRSKRLFNWNFNVSLRKEAVPTPKKSTKAHPPSTDKRTIIAAIALYDACGSAARVSRETGVHQATLRHWLSRREEYGIPEAQASAVALDIYRERIDSLISEYLDIIPMALRRVREALPEASALQAMTIAGIASDKVEATIRRGAEFSEAATAAKLSGTLTAEEQEDIILRAAQIAQRRRGAEPIMDASYDIVPDPDPDTDL
jgi:hypothetical protein